MHGSHFFLVKSDHLVCLTLIPSGKTLFKKKKEKKAAYDFPLMPLKKMLEG